MWKVNGGRRQAPRPKPTVSMLLEKYTSRKTNNVFNRLGGNKRPRSPFGPRGHSNGKEVRMTISRILQWSRHIGVVHLLCIRSFLHGGLILGRHILQGQQVIFSRDGSRRGLCSDQTYMRKGLGSMRKLDHIMPSRFEEVDHRYAMQMTKTIRVVTSAYGCW